MRGRVRDLDQQQAGTRAAGFTLVELLVVILIVGLVSAVALPTIYFAFARRQVSEAARILQGTIVGARDKAIHDNQPSGFRLLPDPAFPLPRRADGTINPPILAYNRMIPLEAPPGYSDGMLSVHSDGNGGSSNYPAAIRTVSGATGVPCLVLEAAPVAPSGAPNAPTSWFWNIRVGDQIQVNNAGPWYTIVGPLSVGPAQGNGEMFVNIGPPGTALPVLVGNVACEYLLLVNGRDDDGNGYVDDGFDGVDNNGDGSMDEAAEWEKERWLGAIGP